LDCLCLGLLCADIVCDPVPALPNPGQIVETPHIELCLGGCAANTAFDLAKLGVDVGLGGCIGEDPFGNFLLQTLEEAGVQTTGVSRCPQESTATSTVINVDGDDRRLISAVGANRLLTSNMISEGLIESAAIVHIGGFLLLDALESDQTLERLRQARAKGALVMLDVIEVKDPAAMERVRRVLPFTDVLLPNRDEAALLTAQSNPWDQAQVFRDAGARTVVITDGAHGTYVMSDGLRLRSEAYPTAFRGGTGAGDAFDAGFIAGHLNGEDLRGCLRWGSAMGASCVRSTSATASVFSKEEALRFMENHTLHIHEVS
jgi:sugar/nucleoside kinase (ribokinase family)